MPLIAIYNPVCGDGTAQAFFEDHVLPLLSRYGKTIDKFVPTMYKGHAGQLVLDFVEDQVEGVAGDITVILGSGDGTLHEIVNHLSSAVVKRPTPFPRLHFVIVPCGTANALFSSLFVLQSDGGTPATAAYKLQSVNSYLYSSRIVPLTLAIARLSSHPNTHEHPQVAVSAVVMSTSLHASILNDSESLRQEMPGIERPDNFVPRDERISNLVSRFKVAASNNSARWYSSSVKLLPAPSVGTVQIYNPTSNTFTNHPDSDEDDPIVDLDGPFIYFLSTVNVDRLESTFRITPLVRTIPPTEASCDLLILRPLRDPSISRDHAQARDAFVPKLWNVLQNAYKDGQHINLKYNDSGDIVSSGDGPTVMEYFRCGGWEWIPVGQQYRLDLIYKSLNFQEDTDKYAHLLCSDGTIFNIAKGGTVVCSAAMPEMATGFVVYG